MTTGTGQPDTFAEIAPGVYVLRQPVLDVNATLIVGDGAALVVDTLSTRAQAEAMRDAARRVTHAPIRAIVNTHHHFDHCLGNVVLAADNAVPAADPAVLAADAAVLAAHPAGGVEIWAHDQAARLLRDEPERLRRQWYEEWCAVDPALAQGIADAEIRPPDHVVHTSVVLTVGGRPVTLVHPGRGHTAGDLVVSVPDAHVLLAGDLVEQGGPPTFEDSYPLDWPATIVALLALAGANPAADAGVPAHVDAPAHGHAPVDTVIVPGHGEPVDTVIVPGHGAPVDTAFVRAQHAELVAQERQIRDGDADGAPVEEVAARSPFGRETGLIAVRRGYADLAGRI